MGHVCNLLEAFSNLALFCVSCILQARQEILQQIAEDKERRVGKLERKQTVPQGIQDNAQASTSIKTSNEHLPDRDQCLLQVDEML